MPNLTPLDIITSALELIMELGAGETPSDEDSDIGLKGLNSMVDGWNADRLNLHKPKIITFGLEAQQPDYLIGPGATFDSDPIILIQSASLIIPGTSARWPMRVLRSEEFLAIPERGLTGALPDKLYCDYEYPISKLTAHPVPSGVVTMELAVWQAIQKFATLNVAIQLRPGYQEALEYNLAVKIAPKFGRTPDPSVVALAQSYKQGMRSLNAQALAAAQALSMGGGAPQQQ